LNNKKRSPSILGLAVLLDETTTDATMKDYGFFLLLIAPLVVPGVITVLKSSSLGAILWVAPLTLLGAIVVAVLFLISGTSWLQLLAPATFESQGGGMSYIVFCVPFLAYSGCVAGASLVAFLSRATGDYPGLTIFQAIAVLLTSVLGGLLPLGIMAILQMLAPRSDGHLTELAIAAIGNALISAWLGSQVAKWLAHIV
jgi:hypothetical protein